MKISKLFVACCLLPIALFLSSCNLPFLEKRKKAALQVTSTPKTTVFLNDEHGGQTPYFDENLKPGEYRLKLVPETASPPLLPWQGVVKLTPGILTVVNRNLGENEEQSSGHVLSLEPIAEKKAVRISIISTPDSVVVNLDGEPKGFTPLSLDNLTEGEHLLTISSPGFREETIKAKTVKGYKLMINVQLAQELEEKASPKPTPSPKIEEDEEATEAADEMERPYVKIKDNPWGYLNVRSEPSRSGGNETVITKVDLGKVFKYIETSENGWYKIEYEEDKMGWVSGKYTKLYQ